MLYLYVTSSEKHIGKTFITSGIAATMQSLGYTTSVYKPIQTSGKELNGFVQSPDLTFLKTIDPYINSHFSYLYKSPLEPIVASEIDNETIDIDYINNEYKRIISVSDCTLIDGDSGILSPIAPNLLVADMIKKLNVPMLIVTEPNENSVNNTFNRMATWYKEHIFEGFENGKWVAKVLKPIEIEEKFREDGLTASPVLEGPQV
jgi:dethiobiotin synthetase